MAPATLETMEISGKLQGDKTATQNLIRPEISQHSTNTSLVIRFERLHDWQMICTGAQMGAK
jgi:hypothetical protein